MQVNMSIELISAARKKDLLRVKELLFIGSDPNESDPHGNLPLHAACEVGALEIVKLIAKKADLNALSYGKPALSYAACNGHIEIVELLLELGAKVDRRSETHAFSNREFTEAGTTPLLELFIAKYKDNKSKWNEREIECVKAL